MNKVDIIILVIVGIFTIIGYYRGILGTAFGLIQWIAVGYFAILLTPVVSQILIETFKLDIVIFDWVYSNPGIFGEAVSLLDEKLLNEIVFRIINVIAIILLFILLKILFSVIFSILNKITKLPILNGVNKIGGIIIGIFEGVVISYLLMILVNWLPVSAIEPIKNELPNSLLGNKVSSLVPSITDEIFIYVDSIKANENKS